MSETKRAITEIESDLAAAQARLANNVTAFIDRVHPKSVADRSLEEAKSKVAEGIEWVKGQLFNKDGSVNVTNAAIAGGGFVGLLVFLKLVRKLFSHK